MVSLRFPFSFPQPPRPPRHPNASPRFRPFIAAAAAAVVGAGIGLAASLKLANQADPSLQRLSSPIWASLSLSDAPTATGTSVEPKTGATFPTALDGGRSLLGIGLRKKSLGVTNINIYAFGVYADESDIKKLRAKYGTPSVSELKGNKEFIADVLDQDLRITVRLQIVYGRLSIGSVRSAFEKSVGDRIKKFSGSNNKELLQSFTSIFKDEYKLPMGSVIELSREQGYVLRTRIDGKEIGRIQSRLLCRSILDLYFGENPFDKRAKEDIQLGLASILQKESD